MLKRMARRALRFMGWWLADGAILRLGPIGALGAPAPTSTSAAIAFPESILRDLEATRIHTWQSKEFQILAFEDWLAAEQTKKYGPLYIAKHPSHLFSQTYEDAAIAEIFARIGTTNKTFVEVGVEDGSENTTRLLLTLGWKGLWVEGNPAHYQAIRRHFAAELASGQLKAVNAMAAPDTIQSLIDAANLGPKIDFLSVDIDQHTSHVFRAIKTKARVACIEYNAYFHPSIEYEVPYRSNESWDGSNWFGASLKTLEKDGLHKGMALVGCDLSGANAYFVERSLAEGRFPQPFSAEHHYQPTRYLLAKGPRGHKRRSVGSTNSA